MKYFWTHKEEIPDSLGYGQFSAVHFLLLVISVLLITLFIHIYIHAEEPLRLLMRRGCAFTLIVIEMIKMILIGHSNVKLAEYLPLEICSFAAYFIVIDSLWAGNTVFPGMLLTLFLPVAIMAILFPTTSTLPVFNFYVIHQFLYHDLIIAYILARFLNREIPLAYPGVWKSIGIILLLAAAIYLIDVRFDKNFMFLRDTYGNPLLKMIEKVTGSGVSYTIGLVIFCIFMIHVFYLIFKFISLLVLY